MRKEVRVMVVSAVEVVASATNPRIQPEDVKRMAVRSEEAGIRIAACDMCGKMAIPFHHPGMNAYIVDGVLCPSKGWLQLIRMEAFDVFEIEESFDYCTDCAPKARAVLSALRP